MIIFGKQPVDYALTHHQDKIKEIYIAKELAKEQFARLKRTKKPLNVLDFKKAQALAHGRNHQGVLLEVNYNPLQDVRDMLDLDTLVVLCGLSDVGNIGAIVRSAYALGAGGVLLTDVKLQASAMEGIMRASAGTLLDMPFCVFPRTLDIINELKMADFTLFGADMAGENIHNFVQRLAQTQSLSQESSNSQKHAIINPLRLRYRKWVLFVGSEGEGLSTKICKKLDTILSVPMANSCDSLNVAHACVILLHRLLEIRG
ncbi:TrmH family RNA methyltransferase [uncultured Helicobacter sp.]|uniref:TrmH family RNA methyltransferase n=1 Tax=uncultured Helicobacter sp. TaxID=175537 RepID=UPI001C3A48A6|nr:RNA methyltransferase [Candidatus Helicobacter avicola]